MYLIKRGPKPVWHKAPYHNVIICNKKSIAEWEAGDTGDHSWVWERQSTKMDGAGFLLVRWNGFDIDYGNVVHDIGDMPDGTRCGFVYPHTELEPWNLLKGAIWWDDKKIPQDLEDAGVIYAPDSFSQDQIMYEITNMPASLRPSFWPNPKLIKEGHDA